MLANWIGRDSFPQGYSKAGPNPAGQVSTGEETDIKWTRWPRGTQPGGLPSSVQNAVILCCAWRRNMWAGTVTFSCSRPFKWKQNAKDHFPEPGAGSRMLPAPAPPSLWCYPQCPSSSREWSAETQSLHLPGRCQSHPQSCWTRPPRWGVAGRLLLFSAVRRLPLDCFCFLKREECECEASFG